MLTVHWNISELRPRPSNPSKRETFYFVTCDCGAEYWLRKNDASKADQCKTCQIKQRASKGYYAAVEKHGRKAILEKMAEKRRLSPSWAEQVVIEMLDALEVYYEREQVRFISDQWYVIDFVIPAHGYGERYIETNGWGHKLPDRAARDARLVDSGYEVLFVTTDDLRERQDEIAKEIAWFTCC